MTPAGHVTLVAGQHSAVTFDLVVQPSWQGVVDHAEIQMLNKPASPNG